MWRDGEGKCVPAEIPRIGIDMGKMGARRHIEPSQINRPGRGLTEPGAAAIRPVQELETIEARAKDVPPPWADA